MYNFLKRITEDGTLKMEYNKNCDSRTKTSTYNELVKNHPDLENLFFSSGIKDTTKNRSAKNIEYVNRITLDLDIRKEYESLYGEEITDEYIIAQGKELGEFLKEERPNDFGQRSFIVFSGNGLQIHYIGKPFKVEGELFSEYFREATKHIYETFYKWMGDPYKPDIKVGDLGHLFRIPNTRNVKKHGRKQCRIIGEQICNSIFIDNLGILINKAKERIERRNEHYKKQMELKRKTNNFSDVDIFADIRAKVDVAQVLLCFVPERPLKKDGKNFFKKGKAGNNSYFVSREKNCIIRNGSTFLGGTKESMNPLDIIQAYTGFVGKDALDWLQDRKFITINK